MEQNSCKIYYCYKATNDVNGKIYIGFATNPQMRWREHKRDADKGKGYIFHQAIRKHGWEHFHFEVVCCGRDKLAMLEFVEPALIEQYQSGIHQHGYNMNRKVMGAVGRVVDKRKSQPCTEETKQKLRVASTGNKYRVGCKDSEEVRKRKSEVLKGNKRSLGRVQPPEIRQVISAASQAMWDILSLEKRSDRVQRFLENGKSTRFKKKLSIQQEENIRIRFQNGERVSALAKEYGVHEVTMCKITGPQTKKNLSLQQKEDILVRLQSGERVSTLAKDYGLHRTTISRIKKLLETSNNY
jgi:group I intron endonuclease